MNRLQKALLTGYSSIAYGKRYLDVFMALRSELTPIRPSSVDPFEISNAFRAEIARAAG